MRANRWSLAALLILAGCGGAADTGTPDVVLVTIDTLRADRVGCYGHAPAQTPTLDRLALEGTRYDQCQAPVPVTLPSHATILTGLNPPRHGIRNNLTYELADGVSQRRAAIGYPRSDLRAHRQRDDARLDFERGADTDFFGAPRALAIADEEDHARTLAAELERLGRCCHSRGEISAGG